MSGWKFSKKTKNQFDQFVKKKCTEQVAWHYIKCIYISSLSVLHFIRKWGSACIENLYLPSAKILNSSRVQHPWVTVPYKLLLPSPDLKREHYDNNRSNPTIKANNLHLQQPKLKPDANVNYPRYAISTKLGIYVCTQLTWINVGCCWVFFYALYGGSSSEILG